MAKTLYPILSVILRHLGPHLFDWCVFVNSDHLKFKVTNKL